MDQPESATPGSELWTQTNDPKLAGAEEAGGALSLRIAYLLRSSWVRRRLVFSILATGILLSLLYALFLPNMYTSTTTLMPPDSASSNSNVALMSMLSAVGP